MCGFCNGQTCNNLPEEEKHDIFHDDKNVEKAKASKDGAKKIKIDG